MASKVLETIIRAKDEATQVLKGVGQGAKDAANKLKSVGEEGADAGHGLHSMLRTARNVAVIFELIPVGIEAYKASLASLNGTSTQAAEGQVALIESIKQFPVIGRQLGDAAVYLGDKWATLWGKQTTSDLIAESKARREALQKFAKVALTIDTDSQKTSRQAALIGLLPTEAEVAKLRAEFKDKADSIFDQKQAISGAQSALQEAVDEKQQIYDKLQRAADVAGIRSSGSDGDVSKARAAEKAAIDAKRDLDMAIGIKADANRKLQKLGQEEIQNNKLQADQEDAIRRKALKDQRDFEAELFRIADSGNKKIRALADDLAQKQFEGANRNYEARLTSLRAALDNEVEEIRDNARKELAALQDKEAELADVAKHGDRAAIERLRENRDAQAQLQKDTAAQIAAAGRSSAQDEANNAQAAIRDAVIAGLEAEAKAGDAASAVEKDRRTTARDRLATEQALLAIMADQSEANKQNAADAKQTLAALHSGYEAILSMGLASSELDILKQRAALGDVQAGIQSHQLELTQARVAEEAKLNSVLADRNASEADRANARKQLDEIKSIPKLEQANGVRDFNRSVLELQASNGSKLAEMQLKKFDLEKKYNDQVARGVELLKTAGSVEEKNAIKNSMGALKSAEANAIARLSSGNQDFRGNQLVESQYLTGAQASATQEKDPIGDAARLQADSAKVQAAAAEKTTYVMNALLAWLTRPMKKI